MKEDKTKKTSSSKISDKNNIQKEVLYAEPAVPFEKEYYRTIDVLIILFVLCIVYVVYDIVKEIFIK